MLIKNKIKEKKFLIQGGIISVSLRSEIAGPESSPTGNAPVLFLEATTAVAGIAGGWAPSLFLQHSQTPASLQQQLSARPSRQSETSPAGFHKSNYTKQVHTWCTSNWRQENSGICPSTEILQWSTGRSKLSLLLQVLLEVAWTEETTRVSLYNFLQRYFNRNSCNRNGCCTEIIF